MSTFEDHGKRCNDFGRRQALERTKATAPRPWAAMLETWGTLLASLCAILRVEEDGTSGPPLLKEPWLAAWRWMWSLPPCSEARKAAFTLGAAAWLIERWQAAQEIGDALAYLPEDLAIGRRAEEMLAGSCRWHIDDARGEAAAVRYHFGAPASVPPHERLYKRADGLVYGSILGGTRAQGLELASAILADYGRPPGGRRRSVEHHVAVFAETAIASLPDGPWMMTTQDVSRFLDMIVEDESHPGPWRRATHVIRGGELEIRERADGRFDVRAVGEAPLGWPLPDQIAERGVDAAYVRAELRVDQKRMK